MVVFVVAVCVLCLAFPKKNVRVFDLFLCICVKKNALFLFLSGDFFCFPKKKVFLLFFTLYNENIYLRVYFLSRYKKK